MATPNRLPQQFLDLNEMSTASRGVSVMYGRRADGSLVALNVAADGTIASNSTFSGTVTTTGSSNSFFTDNGTIPLNGAFQHVAFGFVSATLFVYNDDTTTNNLEFSFDGVAVHGRVFPGEAAVMDGRAQNGIWLRAMTGAPNYRLMVY